MGFLSDVTKGLSSGSFLGNLANGALGLVGNFFTNDARMDLAKYNAAMQKEFAQNSIRWKVEDAKRAGVHPMAALGVSSASFSPVSAQFESPDFSFLSDMGQSIDRAALAAKDKESQEAAKDLADTLSEFNVEKAGLENDLLRAQIASIHAQIRQSQIPPAPKVNVSAPFEDQPDVPIPVGSQPPSGSVDTFDSDPASAFKAVVVGDAIIPVFHPDIADPLSESVHSSTTAKLAYLNAVRNKEILEPPRSSWSASQARRIDSGQYHWVFSVSQWKWIIRKIRPRKIDYGDGSKGGQLSGLHRKHYQNWEF